MKKKKKISKLQTKHIAKLANLQITEKEISSYRDKLDIILEYFDAIKDIDVQEIKETKTTTPLLNRFREDKITPSLSQKETLSNSKNTHKGYFLVKAVFK